MSVITRFAPSPTGELHIGGARTALFNWLFARHHNGKFMLRIEDTDLLRSSDVHTTEILSKLKWLGLDWDGEAVYQSKNSSRHADIAHRLLETGNAYYCYASKEELETLKTEQIKAKMTIKYDGRWRDKDPSMAPTGINPVIRLKMPLHGTTVINDAVQGSVTVQNSILDDMIILRADGTPTYMLAAVVDDYDMGVTHVIRGDDHLNNAFRQIQIYRAMGWKEPVYAHIPLIHGEDGKKLSKRNGAPGIDSYVRAQFLPPAILNYLVRLGWGHKNDEFFTVDQMIQWFDLSGIKRGPARLDMKKLHHINAYYLRSMAEDDLLPIILPIMENSIGYTLTEKDISILRNGLTDGIKHANTINELAMNMEVYVLPAPQISQLKPECVELLKKISKFLANVKNGWNHSTLQMNMKSFALLEGEGYATVMQTLRHNITQSRSAYVNMFDIMIVLGYDEIMSRLNAVLK